MVLFAVENKTFQIKTKLYIQQMALCFFLRSCRFHVDGCSLLPFRIKFNQKCVNEY